jgi:hypothetical protein
LTGRDAADTIGAMVSYETRTRRFTRAEYDRLIELGIFQPDEEIELIGGELLVEPCRQRLGRDGTCGPRVRSGSTTMVYREPVVDETAPFGWRYARLDVFDVSARVGPLAVPGASVRVADLFP